MNFTWRAAGLNYLQASNIAARALRRVLVAEKRAEAAKRDVMGIKVAKWTSSKAPETVEIPVLQTKEQIVSSQ
ncbi:hypothetical protein BB560_005699 [Smittium megazygosporum]|uniref:ATP synthase subunit epsilon, mitochondrial n=1 Tax=Smittium megazygosporum TaxID=133381 RepID=A0A2T9Z104_9FUNG|nr:hypothetical protein BB560_005699 [Smittium megazygosporum]